MPDFRASRFGRRPTTPPRILVVDDDQAVRSVLLRLLTAEGYECAATADGVSALQRLLKERFDLVIADIMMPGLSGMALLREIEDRHLGVGVIILTALEDSRLAVASARMGATGHILKPFDARSLLAHVADALERRRLTDILTEYEDFLASAPSPESGLRYLQEDSVTTHLRLVMEHREPETPSHIGRMRLYAAHLAARRGWSKAAVEDMRLAAGLHDIGKTCIPRRILFKRGALTRTELQSVQRHTVAGATLLEGRDVPLVRMAVEIARHHHERWDGMGYPDRLAGDMIPESARIVALLDLYDSLAASGDPHGAIAEPEALLLMSGERGRRLDPEMYDSFIEELPALRRLRQEAEAVQPARRLPRAKSGNGEARVARSSTPGGAPDRRHR